MFACYWIALDWHDKAYVYREIHKPGLYATEAAELIRKSNVDSHGREENIYQWFAPSDLDNKNNQTGKSTLDILREAGVDMATPAPLEKTIGNFREKTALLETMKFFCSRTSKLDYLYSGALQQ